MRTCLNLVTVCRLPLEVQIKAAYAAGFEGIEPWVSQIEPYLQQKPYRDLRKLLQSCNLKVASIISISASLWKSEEEFEKSLEVL